jgi:hypothetical protein
MEDTKKRKRVNNIIYYKCFLCSHITTNKSSMKSHSESIKHLINNYEKHPNHETDINDYIGLLMNEKINDFEIGDDEDIKNFNIKNFNF